MPNRSPRHPVSSPNGCDEQRDEGSGVDLNTVTSYRFATSRADLALAPGEKVLGGGTWLFSEPQPDVTGLVDLVDDGRGRPSR